MLISSLAVLNCGRIFLSNSMPNVRTKFPMDLNQKATMTSLLKKHNSVLVLLLSNSPSINSSFLWNDIKELI